MFSFAVLALAASANAHSFSHIRRHHVPRAQPPPGWATNYLEKYDAYHERYMAIGCENKHNTTFFDFCCHPLLATETVAKNRPACCAVGATAACPGTVASSTAAHVSKPSTAAAVAKPSTAAAVSKPSTAAAPHSTAADNEDGECEDEDDGNADDDNTDDEECEDDEDTGNDDGDDDGEECEDDGEEDTSAAPTSTKVAATSHSAVVTTSTQQTTPTTTHTTPTTTPKTTTSTKAATTHTTPKPTTTSNAATPTKTSSGNFITGGFGTWFTQGGVAGACGKVHKDTDFVVALDTKMYANGINCGRTIRVTDLSNGKTADGLVADECPTCRNGQSVDMSVAMFKSLADLSVGEFSLKYEFLD